MARSLNEVQIEIPWARHFQKREKKANNIRRGPVDILFIETSDFKLLFTFIFSEKVYLLRREIQIEAFLLGIRRGGGLQSPRWRWMSIRNCHRWSTTAPCWTRQATRWMSSRTPCRRGSAEPTSSSATGSWRWRWWSRHVWWASSSPPPFSAISSSSLAWRASANCASSPTTL